jgi:hypothetical protein
MRLLLPALLLLSACSAPPQGGSDPATPPTGYVMVRSYVDRYTLPTGDELRRIEYGWDYDRGEAEQRVYAMDGTLLERNPQPGLTLQLTHPSISVTRPLTEVRIRGEHAEVRVRFLVTGSGRWIGQGRWVEADSVWRFRDGRWLLLNARWEA